MFAHSLPDNLEDIPSGAELAAVLESLDWEQLSAYDVIRALQAQQRQIAHYEAGSAWSVNRVVEAYQLDFREGSYGYRDAQDGAAAEIGASLRLTRRAAQGFTDFSVELYRRYPRVYEALLFGKIDLRRARILVDGTQCVSAAVTHEVIEQLLPEAPRLTIGQLRHRIQKLCIDADPEAARQRYDDFYQERRLVVRATDAGTADLSGMDLNPKDAAEINTWIHREAALLRRRGDKRTVAQLRADIYVDLLQRRHRQGRGGYGNRGGGVHLDTTLDSLAGLRDASGELNRYGPVSDDIARQIAAHQTDTEWTRTLRDPDSGQPIDGGIIRRRPTTAQKRLVHARHRTCVHPGCRMPAANCDIDHRIPWHQRRVTCTGDLAPCCRWHHTIRHTFGWTYDSTKTDCIFTSPLGHRCTTSGRPP